MGSLLVLATSTFEPYVDATPELPELLKLLLDFLKLLLFAVGLLLTGVNVAVERLGLLNLSLLVLTSISLKMIGKLIHY